MEKTSIQDLKEKRLLVTRRLLMDQIDPTDENIIAIWRIISMSDANKVDKALIDWIRKHVNSNSIKSCNDQLANVRCKGERNLKNKGQRVGYGAKLVKSPKDTLATYNIFTKGKKYSGSYGSLSRRIGGLPKIEK